MSLLKVEKLFKHLVTSSSLLLKSTVSTSALKMNIFTEKSNRITGSTEWAMQHEDYDFHQEIARSAFADMLHDTERNKKYYHALKMAITKMHATGKEANVLDIGTGTGLLSIYAANCGADSIVACEAFRPMAACCLKILEKNCVADRIKVIPKRSTELTVGENGDLKKKANILVTEVFDTELIGEGALSTFSHAHKHLLEADCIVVPDSAVIYAQVVECPTLQNSNKLNDLVDEEAQVVLRTPEKMNKCPGSAAVNDIQLCQLPWNSFHQLSEPIPVFNFDWSGRSPPDFKRLVKHQFTTTQAGKAQMVFMWWELNMDTEGKVTLSCAPWWAHPDADTSAERPQDSIPWRDHWMQAVYYFPEESTVKKDTEMTLVSCHDEYSLWFYLEGEEIVSQDYKRPICDCGVHMVYSRTQISYLNDGRRSKKFLARLKDTLDSNSVVFDLNGGSLMGLAAAKIAKSVHILESMTLKSDIIWDYAKENALENVAIVPDIDEFIKNNCTHIICDPNFTTALLPWDNLRMAYLMQSFKEILSNSVIVIPERCEFWAMPVEFKDLQNIRMPLGTLEEGINMTLFDDQVEHSREISDAALEAQPLWEYPSKCRAPPQRLLEIDLIDIKHKYASDATHAFDASELEERKAVNGFVVWVVWSVGGRQISTGPIAEPLVDAFVEWDPHTRQAVKLLKQPYYVDARGTWSYQVACDLEKGQFDLDLLINDLVNTKDV